ncbi:MAG: glycosyltransferase family 2 protein [Acidobacteriota bacterium]
MTHELLWAVVAGVLVACTLPGTLELAALTLGSFVPRRRRRGTVSELRGLAIVVPAHDEEQLVGDTVRRLVESEAATCPVQVVVVADNCSDGTADEAAAAGGRVLVRDDPARRGKGFALDHAFRLLLAEPFDAFLVIDADTEVSSDVLKKVVEAFEGGAAAVQCRYDVANPEASARTRLRGLAFLAFNFLRLRSRERLGISVGILGNGFGLTRATLEKVPYGATSIVEDLEYHLLLVRAGIRVRYLEEAVVLADLPVGAAETQSQSSRWEGGRIGLMRRLTPGLALDALRGRTRLVEPLFELLLLPLSYHVALLVVLAAVPTLWGRAAAVAGLALVALHVLVAATLGGRLRDLPYLFLVPGFVLGKVLRLRSVLAASRRDADWVRTGRENPAVANPQEIARR